MFGTAGIEFHSEADLLGSADDLAPKLNGVTFRQFDFKPDQFFLLNGSAAQNKAAGPAYVGDRCGFLVQGAFPTGWERYSYAWELSSFIYHVCGGCLGQIGSTATPLLEERLGSAAPLITARKRAAVATMLHVEVGACFPELWEKLFVERGLQVSNAFRTACTTLCPHHTLDHLNMM